MHITDLRIDRFGIWRDLTLPLGGPGLNVLYGPNEAGKSTLMRFLKAALYGSDAPRSESDPSVHDDSRHTPAGSLRFIRDGLSYTLHRRFSSSPGGQLRLIGPGDESLSAERLSELLSGTSEAVFERVFAVDLYELQELATLDHHELAGRVYGLSLDGRGRRLLSAVDDLRRRREMLLGHQGQGGRLARLLDHEDALLGEIRRLPDLAGLRAELLDERDAIDAEVSQLKARRSELGREQRGRRFLERVHPVWEQIHEFTAELEELPPAIDLPANGVARLEALERERESLRLSRDEWCAAAAEAKKRIDVCGPEPAIIGAEPALRVLFGLRGWLTETTAARDAAAEASKRRPTAVSVLPRAAAAAEWTDERIATVDTSAAAQLALADAARDYRLALGRRAELKKRYRALRQATSRREMLVEQRLARIGGSPDVAAAELRRRLSGLESLAELRAKETALLQGGESRQRLAVLSEALDVPPWVTLVLGIFALGGALFAVLGLVTGVLHNVVAGAAYLLLGLTSASIAYRLRSHFQVALDETAKRVGDAQGANEAALRGLREEIARLEAATAPERSAGSEVLSAPPRRVSLADSIRDAVKEFAQLDEIVDDQERVVRRRKQLTSLRSRLRKVQQALETARQAWCATLVRIGLPESLEVEASLDLWRQLAEAAASRNSTDSMASERALLNRMLQSFADELEAVGSRFGLVTRGADRCLQTLERWQDELDAALRTSSLRRSHIEDLRTAKRNVAEASRRLKVIAGERRELLTIAGVKSSAEFASRVEATARRSELEELLSLAEGELASLASAEPELAIVEEDLRSFEPSRNADALARLAQEQEGLEARLESALERRGSVSRRLEELEADDRTRQLRRTHGRLDTVIVRTMERLLALRLAEISAEQARAAWERDHQPPVLAAASDSLARLTRNRYVRIWAPLGERSLRVDDDHDRTFAVEQLSGGTREQLFLALRLGLVRHASERGVKLPLILDDVLVNFDQLRTEAAFETLRDFADEGRQVLFFTCHLHLAHLAENRGISPIWLPGHQPPMQQRLAG